MKHYSEAMNQVLFQKSWAPIFRSLTDAEAGKVIKSVYDFMSGNDPELDDPKLDGIFLMIADSIECSAKKYLAKVQYFRSDDE